MYSKWFLFIYIYLSANFVFAGMSSTFTISPLKYCQEFKVEVEHQTNYKLSFKTSPDIIAETKTLYVKDLTNLESVTNILTETAEKFCPLSLEQVSIDGIYTCQKENLGPYPFSEDYISFLNNVIELTNQSFDKCSKVSSLIKLQLDISQLDKTKILKMKEANDILKVFTGDTTDDIIDLYHECRTSGDSESFLTNLILLEGKNQCLFPTPPGQLSYNEFHKIAKAAGEKFKNEGIFSLNSKKNHITKFVVRHTAETVLKKVANSLLPIAQIEDILNKSEIIQNLDAVKPDLISDYTKYVLPNRAPLKLIDIALLPMVQYKFKGPLKDIRNSKALIKETIYPLVKDSFNSCIEGFKNDIDYETKRSIKEDIEYFKKQENAFCVSNPKECNKTSCNRKVNFSTTNKNVTDAGRIQACIFKAFNTALDPTLDSVLTSQYSSLKGALSINGGKIKDLSSRSAANIRSCTKESLELIHKNKFNSQYDIYHYASAEKFAKTLGTCVKKEEEKITKFFSLEILKNMTILKENFSAEQTNIISNNIVDQALDSCLQTQKKRVDSTMLSPSSCKPIIELTGASRIIPQILKKTMSDKNVDPKTITSITNDFSSCAKSSIKKANSDLFNKKGPTPFLSAKENNEYIKTQSDFYDCFSMGLDATTISVIDKTFEDMELKNKVSIEEMELGEAQTEESLTFLAKVMKEGKELTSKCFEQYYSQIKDWPHFLAVSNSNFIDNTKEICTERATKYILPKLVISLTNKSIEEVLSSKILPINFSQLLKIMHKKGDTDTEKILSLRSDFLKSYPEKTTDEFTQYFKDQITKEVFAQIHNNFFKKLKTINTMPYEVEELSMVLPPVCLEDLHKVSKAWPELKKIKQKNKNKPAKNSEESPFTFLLNLISNSIKHTVKTGSFYDFKEAIKVICNNPTEYDSMEKLLAQGTLYPIIESETTIKVKNAFIEDALKQCADDLLEYEINIPTRYTGEICSNEVITKNDMKTLITYAAQSSTDKALILRFIIERKNNTLKAVNHHLTNEFIRDIMNNDESINKYISDNILDFTAGDKQIVSNVYNKTVNAIFKNNNSGSFTDDFLSSQIINTVGIVGHKDAKKIVLDRMNNLKPGKETLLKNKVRPEIMNQFLMRWNPSGIKNYLNWKNTSQEKKQEFYSLILSKKILPKFDTSLSKEQKEIQTKTMTKQITDYVFFEPVFKEDNQTFPEKLKADITKSVTENVEKSVWSEINPFD